MSSKTTIKKLEKGWRCQEKVHLLNLDAKKLRGTLFLHLQLTSKILAHHDVRQQLFPPNLGGEEDAIEQAYLCLDCCSSFLEKEKEKSRVDL